MSITLLNQATGCEESELALGSPLFPLATAEQESRHDQNEPLRLDSVADTRDWFLPREGIVEFKDQLRKIELGGFSPNCPWLQPAVLRLLEKTRKGPITEKEMVTLMQLVAERASDHFRLEQGKFVAMTFHGRIVEVSDTRVGLLKKMQGRRCEEQVFLWRIGFNAFSGRI